MTGRFYLDWAIIAVSLFNTIVLLWLGLTVLLTARRKSWGVWLAGGGLLLGGAFFISHSAILGRGLQAVGRGMNFWWYVGWGPVIVSPLAWYVVMLWYAGFWRDRRSSLRRRQGVWFLLTGGVSVALVGMLFFIYPLPSFVQVAVLDLSAAPSVAGIPVLILAYPFYTLLCISLSFDALRHPSPSGELMRDEARRRARPWLLGSTVLLLVVSLLVAWVMAWIVFNARQRAIDGIYTSMSYTLGWFDLAISSLIALAVALLGQAVVAYEIFTGETLPRRGFFRHWRNAIILAAGYGVVVGGALVIQLRPVYMLLLTTVLMVVFYALVGWRSFGERERYIAHLRPFVSSQRLYDSVLTAAAATPSLADVDVATLFRALCEDVLGVQSACLIAVGTQASLIGAPLVFPGARSTPSFSLAPIIVQFDSPQTMCVPLDPALYGGATWAVSLWRERGLLGVLLLGKKQGGGLYTQEEIEIARASGERLIDTLATVEMSRRLLALLRQRIAQVKVIEGQGRRVLHDQILPQLHEAILSLSGRPDAAVVQRVVEALTSAYRQIADLMRDTASATPHRLSQQGLVAALRAWIAQDSTLAHVSWRIQPEAVGVLDRLPVFVNEVIFFAAQELVRNAVRHGARDLEARSLRLEIAVEFQDGLHLAVVDDGVGFGLGPSSTAGVHNGLWLHSTMLAAVGGSLSVAALPGGGTRATIDFGRPALDSFND